VGNDGPGTTTGRDDEPRAQWGRRRDGTPAKAEGCSPGQQGFWASHVEGPQNERGFCSCLEIWVVRAVRQVVGQIRREKQALCRPGPGRDHLQKKRRAGMSRSVFEFFGQVMNGRACEGDFGLKLAILRKSFSNVGQLASVVFRGFWGAPKTN